MSLGRSMYSHPPPQLVVQYWKAEELQGVLADAWRSSEAGLEGYNFWPILFLVPFL